MTIEEPTTRVLVIDDHAVVRAGLCALLDLEGGIDVVAEAGDGEAGFRAYVDITPDVVVMDLRLPGISGLETIRRIVARTSGVKILAFSIHEDTAFVTQALQAGARGYVAKSAASKVVIYAIGQIALGNIYLEPDVAQRLAVEKTKGPNSPFARLTTREFEIFCLIAQGLSASDIGNRLALSAKTVANYSTQIKSKLEVKSIAGIVRMAIQNGVIEV
jgi:two-component system invasion response regulator UvrY